MKKISEETITKIKELYDQKLTYKEIGFRLNISVDTIRKYLKERYGIIKKANTALITEENRTDFEKALDEGKTDEELAEIFSMSLPTVKRYRTDSRYEGKYNYKTFSQEEHKLSEIQDQFIRGSLLGDLNISNPHKNRSINSKINIVHSKKQEELFMKKVEILGEFMGSYKLCIPAPDKRTGKIYETWRGHTKNHKVFTDIYDELYINGVKTITPAFLDTIYHPIALAYWFMVDGTNRGTIATHSFGEQGTDLLINWMLDEWNIKCTKQREASHVKLYIKSESRYEFEKMIFPYMIPSMYYKLKFKDQLIAESVVKTL